MSSPSGEYYKAIGLLAICDAIDSADALPFDPSPDQLLPQQSGETAANADNWQGKQQYGRVPIAALPGPYPPVSVAPTRPSLPQHAMLAHVPLISTSSVLTGTVPYAVEQQDAYKCLPSIMGLSPNAPLPPQPFPQYLPPPPPGFGRPAGPVSHSVPPLPTRPMMAMGGPQKPVPQSMQAVLAPNVPPFVPSMMPQGGTPGMTGSQMPPIPPQGPQMDPPMPSPMTTHMPSHISSQMSPEVMSPAGPQPLMRQAVGHSLAQGSFSQAAGSHVRAPSLSASVSTSVSPTPLRDDDPTLEICHVCQRPFRGPKSSTHKQQHIRRLHPDVYTPKRGGKKRLSS